MQQQTLRVVAREDEETGDILVTQGGTDEEAGRLYLVHEYPESTITRVRGPKLDLLDCLFWRVRLHSLGERA